MNLTNNNQTDFKLIEVKNNKVNARGLWKFLGSNRQFSNWIVDRLQDFEEGIDFNKIVKPHKNNTKDYLLTVETAKHLCMIERNQKGKSARKYFIACEEKLKEKQTPKSLSIQDILKLNIKTIEKLQERNNILEKENTALANRDLEVKTNKDYKWKTKVRQDDRGRSINWYVNQYFFEGDYKEAHDKAKQFYRESTGKELPSSAKAMSENQKKDYLNWLSENARNYKPMDALETYESESGFSLGLLGS